ncbi:unnamed protein product [Amoebophrya sp. A25]|nr:unnamed protein product [Amoebophrya sp. A25]|eukprot:GSA25T00027991001.1
MQLQLQTKMKCQKMSLQLKLRKEALAQYLSNFILVPYFVLLITFHLDLSRERRRSRVPVWGTTVVPK